MESVFAKHQFPEPSPLGQKLHCRDGLQLLRTIPLMKPSVLSDTFGEAGNDTLTGRSGADILNGGVGGHVLIGSAGADILFGGDGDDVLIGGPGVDVLDGGPGSNVVIPD